MQKDFLRLRIVSVLLFLFFFSACGQGESQETPDAGSSPPECLRLTPQGSNAITVTREAKVSIFFKVTDCAGKPLPEVLTADDFELFENGARLSTESSHYIGSNKQQFRSYTALLLDVSGSIYSQLPELENSASAFVDQILSQDSAQHSQGANFVAIFTLDGLRDIMQLSEASNDPVYLKSRIKLIGTEAACRANGYCRNSSTNLNGGIMQGLERLNVLKQAALSSGIPNTETALVVFTDGADTAAWNTSQQAQSSVSASPHHVFTIGLRSRDLDENALRLLGKDDAVYANDVTELKGRFQELGKRIEDIASSYYLLQYCSPKRNGTGHELKVTGNYDALIGGLVTKFDVANWNGLQCFADPDGTPGYPAGQALASSRFGGSQDDRVTLLAADRSGSVFLAGVANARFDATTGSIRRDVFVTKQSANDAIAWSKQLMASVDGVDVSSMAVDSAGDVVLAGIFSGTVNFGGGPVSASQIKTFIVKYGGETGELKWAKFFNGYAFFGSRPQIWFDSSGNVVFAGALMGSFDFGGGIRSVVAGQVRVFLAKYSATTGAYAGDAIHTVATYSTSGPNGLWIRTVSSDRSGGFVIAGGFGGAISFGNRVLTSGGLTDGCVARYAANGAVTWATRFGGTSDDTALAITQDASDNVIVTGQADAQQNAQGVFTSGKLFVGRFLGTTGTMSWSKTVGGTSGVSVGNAVMTNGGGDVIAAGAQDESYVVDSNGIVQPSVGRVFVVRFSASDGSVSWQKAVASQGGAGDGQAITEDPLTRNLLVGGAFKGRLISVMDPL